MLSEFRKQGAAEVQRLGFPTTRNEDWLYTNGSLIADGKFTRGTGSSDVSLNTIAPFLFSNPEWPRVVFVNGMLSQSLSTLDALPDGVRVQSLGDAAAANSEVLSKHLGTIVPPSRDGFAALNASGVGNGVVVHVAKEMVSEIPLHLVHVVTGDADGLLSQPRHLIVVERHAKASVIESFVSLGRSQSFTNTVTEVVVEMVQRFITPASSVKAIVRCTLARSRRSRAAIHTSFHSRSSRAAPCRAPTSTPPWLVKGAAPR